MTTGDQKRGAVICASYRLMQLLNTKAGNTVDWPIRIHADFPEAEELKRLMLEVNTALKDLFKDVPHDAR